jgi:predicted NUDIX family NTP pyrophosphohydrolase
MPARTSAGLLMYRLRKQELEVFLAHPGGPFFVRKDDGYWSIPKGEIEVGEDLLEAAIREFKEEIGLDAAGPFLELGSIRQKGGKIVHAWAFSGEWDDGQAVNSNLFELEWPPASGRKESFPEVDRARFFGLTEARKKLKTAQHDFLERLRNILQLEPKVG